MTDRELFALVAEVVQSSLEEGEEVTELTPLPSPEFVDAEVWQALDEAMPGAFTQHEVTWEKGDSMQALLNKLAEHGKVAVA